MKILILILLVSCAHQKTSNESEREETIGISSVMDHIYASYLKGCVDANIEQKTGPSFQRCKEKAIKHRREVQKSLSED